MTASPFPGMNPWLEGHWRDMHTRLMVYIGDALQEELPPDLVAQVEESVTIQREFEDRTLVAPDVSVVEKSEFSPLASGSAGTSATAVAVPLVVSLDRVERHIEIVDTTSDARVVTVVEVLSPSNKLPGADRNRYLSKQQTYIESNVNLVEIDLIRAGDFVVAASPASLPPAYLEPYIVSVRRAEKPDEAEVYHLPLWQPLSTIRVPLRPTDPDAMLDLQRMLDTCFTRGRYDRKIDYAVEPYPRLSEADREWAHRLLDEAGLQF